MPAYPNPQSVAVANALRGEPTTVEVAYPVTGDPALDLASGILAIIKATTGLRAGQVLDVLRYLAARQERADKENQLQAQVWAKAQLQSGTTYVQSAACDADAAAKWRAAQLANDLSHGQLLRPMAAQITCRAEDKP